MQKKVLHNKLYRLRLFCFVGILLFTIIFGMFLGLPAHADSAKDSVSVDNTNVLDDLKSATIDGKPFKVSDYPYVENGLPQLLTFSEYRFSLDSAKENQYGLYVYVYNPSGVEYAENGNSIQLAVEYSGNTPVLYDNFDLAFCSKSTASSTLDLFYKFKVIDSGARLYNRVCATPNSRRYDVTGIQLLAKGARNAVDCKVAGIYTYSGYAVGCGENNKESTLDFAVTDFLTTLRLDVKQTFYRTQSSAQGKYHQNQLNAVYFSIPKEVSNALGKIKSIHCEWYEYKTKPIVVTKDRSLYNALLSQIGKKLPNVNGKAFYDKSVKPSFVFGDSRTHGSSSSDGWYQYGYNICPTQSGDVKNRIDVAYLDSLYYLFYDSNCLNDYTLPRETLIDWIYDYPQDYTADSFLDIKDGKTIPAALFESSVDSGRTLGKNNVTIDDSLTFDLLSYSENHGFWDSTDDYGFFQTLFGHVPQDDSLKDIKPFYLVDSKDMLATNDSLSSNLFIDKSDISEFRDYYNIAERKNENVYMFRFALTDYYSAKGKGNSSKNDISFYNGDNNLFGAQETVFFDFDIIDIGFMDKQGKSVVIPVISNPIDVVGSVTSPVEFDDTYWWIWLILAVILLLICIPILPTIISFIAWGFKGLLSVFILLVKGLWWLISAPFRLIISLISGKG